MKKLLCLVLATFMIFGLIGCSGTGVNAKSTTYTVSDTLGSGDEGLSEFFGGKVSAELSAYAPVLFSFAIALHDYPEVLTQTPDSNFGWCFLYHMLSVYDLRPDGVKDTADGIEATFEAVEKLQKDTLGGAIWVTPGPHYTDRVSYDPSRQLFTCADADSSDFTCQITSAAFNAETSLAEVTVSLTDAAGAAAGSFLISLRLDETSAYRYVISSFRAA